MNRRSRMILVSLIPAVVGALIALWFFRGPNGFGDAWLWAVMAGLGAMITGALCWWFFVERTGEVTNRNYVVAGLACGIVAHPLMWLLYFTVIGLLHAPSGNVNVVELFTSFVSMTLLSLVFAGWATAAIGAAGGWLFGKFWAA